MNPIRKYRKEHELTQVQLARRLGVQQDRISALETEAVDPRLSTLREIVKRLNIDPRGWFEEEVTAHKDPDAKPVADPNGVAPT